MGQNKQMYGTIDKSQLPKGSVSLGVKLLLHNIMSVMRIAGRKAECYTTFEWYGEIGFNDVYVKTPMAMTLKDCVELNKILGSTMIQAKSDSLFIKIG